MKTDIQLAAENRDWEKFMILSTRQFVESIVIASSKDMVCEEGTDFTFMHTTVETKDGGLYLVAITHVDGPKFQRENYAKAELKFTCEESLKEELEGTNDALEARTKYSQSLECQMVEIKAELERERSYRKAMETAILSLAKENDRLKSEISNQT